MEAPSTTEYNQIKIVGTISVESIDRLKDVKGALYDFNVVLILGPTGAGKSTFIEALDSNKSLKISSNQLEGFTQSISLYRLNNVRRYGDPIYLVDVPGFADTKISEMKIVLMLRDWMKEVELPNLIRILYFTPINHPRLPGSHRQVLRTFRALTGVETGKSIMVVSTMWDCVWSDTGRKRAESNFNQLRDDIWKEYVDNGTDILKFHNTQESALSILDKAFDRYSMPDFALAGMTGSDATHIQDTSFGIHLYSNLQQRIQNLHMDIANMQSDLLGAAERDDAQLAMTLVPRLDEVQRLLANFEQEMHEFEQSPTKPAPSSGASTSNPTSDSTIPASRTGTPDRFVQTFNIHTPHRGKLVKALDWINRSTQRLGKRRDD